MLIIQEEIHYFSDIAVVGAYRITLDRFQAS
jgi:hypothetical protein